jgi:hypothetical protein
MMIDNCVLRATYFTITDSVCYHMIQLGDTVRMVIMAARSPGQLGFPAVELPLSEQQPLVSNHVDFRH